MASVSSSDTTSFSAEVTPTLTSTTNPTVQPTSPSATITTTTTTATTTATTTTTENTTTHSTTPTSPPFTSPTPTSTSNSRPTSETFTRPTTFSSTTSTQSTTSVPVVPTATPNNGSSGLSTGAIVGIAIGSAVGFALIVVAIFFIRRHHKKHRKLDFDSDVIFNPVGMSEHRPLGGAGYSTNQNRHDSDDGGVNGSSLGPSTRPSEDIMNTNIIAVSGYAGRSDDQVYHPENDPRVHGGYGDEDRRQQHAQGYYQADQHIYDSQGGDVRYQQQQGYPNGYQAEGGWYGADGYYNADQNYHGGYEGYHDDQQYASDIQGPYIDPARVHDPHAVIHGPVGEPGHGSQTAGVVGYHDGTSGRQPQNEGSARTSTFIPQPSDSPTIKVESAMESKTEEGGSGTEDGHSKRFSQISVSQASLDSAGNQKRNPQGIISDSK